MKRRWKPTANPSGLLTLKNLYEQGAMSWDEYLEERKKLLNYNVYKGEYKRNGTVPRKEKGRKTYSFSKT